MGASPRDSGSPAAGAQRTAGHLHRPRWRRLEPAGWLHGLRLHAEPETAGDHWDSRAAQNGDATAIAAGVDDDDDGRQSAATPDSRLRAFQSEDARERPDH